MCVLKKFMLCEWLFFDFVNVCGELNDLVFVVVFECVVGCWLFV